MNRVVLTGLLLVLLWGCAPGNLPPWLTAISVHIQSGDDLRWAQPAWDDSQWQRAPWWQVGSYDRIVWLRAHIASGTLPKDRNVKVAFSAVGAYELYWNGTRIGGSGRPGGSREQETVGSMDSVTKIPPTLITEGDNVLAVRLSSFHLASRVGNTVHLLYLAPDPQPMYWRLRSYLPGLAASGALLLGACYFAALFVSDRRDRAAGYLALLTFAAVCQFGAESLRGLVNYDYPLHLVRLWMILAMACLFALGLVAYVTERCARTAQPRALIAAVVLAGLLIPLTPGYDAKTTVPIAVGASVSLWFALTTRPRRLLLLFAPATLLLALVGAPISFLDANLYLIIVAAIVLLFLEQVRALRSEQRARGAAEVRSARLELELLKRYIQPHFLLNSLTSLLEWVETDPKAGARMITALADEFRLLLRISAERTIVLRDEIALCRLHLEVMSLRTDARLQLNTNTIEDSLQLPPAVLHTLIENALTHGHYPLGAVFELRQSIDSEHCRYELTCPPGQQADAPARDSACDSRGTGLDYVRARLTEVFAEHWQLEGGRALDGSWITRITVPLVPPCTPACTP